MKSNDGISQKVAVVTGASKGIGLETAKLFCQKGYKVFDLSRSGVSNEYFEHIDCDVSNAQTITNACNILLDKCKRIDCLVCNAGYGISGATEFTLTEDAKKQFEVNFFGAFDTVKAFLPVLREQGFGNIVFVGSVAGEFPIPFQAFYSASKSALHALCCALRQEVKSFGVKVSVVLPGDTKTEFTANRQKSLAGQDVYVGIAKSVNKMEKDEQKGKSCNAVAKTIFKQGTKKRPKVMAVVGADYRFLVFLKRLLPATMTNDIVGKMYCKK